MIIEKSIRLPAPIQKVWNGIVDDMEGLFKCMPGVETVESTGENRWHLILKQKISFMSVTLDVDLKLINLRPPTHLETKADATAGMGMGKVFQNQSLDLKAVSANETEAVYKADVSLSGRMGTLGQRVLGGKVDELADKFAKAFVSRLTGQGQ